VSAVKSRKRRAGKLVVILPVVVVFSAAAAFAGVRVTTKKSSATNAATTRTVQVTRGTISQTVSASGTLAPADTEDLNFASSGAVTAVDVKVGQQVKKGQVLATIDSAALQSQVVQAEAQVAAANSTLSSDTTAGASSAQLAADTAALASDQAQYASAVTALVGSSLVSPIAGTVSTVNLTVGQQLGSTGGSATSVGKTSSAASSANSSAAASSTTEIEVVSSSLVVNLSVDDTQIGKLKVGQAATVSASSTSSTATATASTSTSAATQPSTTGSTAITGKVTSVGTIASDSSGVASFPVVVAVTGSTTALYSGATASVVVTYHQLPNVVVVPSLAVSVSNGSSSVTVSANGKTTKQKVTTGLSSGGQVEIKSGLTAGQEVVITIPAAVARPATGSTGSGGRPNGGFGGGGFGGGGGFTPPAGGLGGGAGQ
jgi:macrolide-specific efflux system membrane fusion protein